MGKIIGITAEYNPFHNGHIYLAEQAREHAGADCVIAVMSGDFTQRGEPAVCDKWERAAAAVKAGGADLVIELPFVFACSRAEVFAAGAVDMLTALGADCIAFGCEAEDPEQLRTAAAALTAQEETIAAAREAFLQDGISGAKAFELAVSDVVGEEAALLLREPNNILAVEYLKRIQYWADRGRSLEDLPVRRYGSGYAEASGQVDFAGAGALRKMLRDGEDISRYIPAGVAFADVNAIEENYLQQLKGVLLRSTPEDISRICGVGEGMENSILREARRAADLNGLLSALTSKRYTGATVRRALTHILTGNTWEQIDGLTSHAPGAGRLLAAGSAGRAFLRQRSDEDFRIITNMNKEEADLAPADAQMLRLDERAADLYNLLCGRDIYAASDRVRQPYIGA